MIDRMRLYDILYALAARSGREDALFGRGSALAREAFAHSLASPGFPEIWFELPCIGEPWFDLHALTSHEQLSSDSACGQCSGSRALDQPLGGPTCVQPSGRSTRNQPPSSSACVQPLDSPALVQPFGTPTSNQPSGTSAFAPETCGGYPEVFAWFAAQPFGVRQLALSWDVSSGNIETPAIQLLLTDRHPRLTCEFLEATGRQDTVSAYRAFLKRLPTDWFACYTGVFAQRAARARNLRVECIPSEELQQAYATDAQLLERHLRQVGCSSFGSTLIPRCHALAKTPFRLEFQFDVDTDGFASSTFGASVRFAPPFEQWSWRPFDPHAEAGKLMRQVEDWGLADERWQLLADTSFCMRASLGGESAKLYCFPAFLKLRWHDGEPLDAKAYLMAGVQ